MLSDTIKAKLQERFSEPLPEYHERRIVIWRDESGEFVEQVDEISLSGVTLIKLTGHNNFLVKKLLTADDLTGDYLIYDPLVYETPQDNWILDIELFSGEPFLADLVSMQMAELNIEHSSAMRKTTKQYAKFLDSKERKAKLRKIGRSYHTPLQLHTDIMAVLCGLNGGTAQDVIIAVLSAGLDKMKNTALMKIRSFADIETFWRMVQKFTGYADTADKSLGELAAHILLTAFSQSVSISELKGLERFVSESCTAYCYQLIHEWQYSETRDDLYEMCRYVERELRLADRFDKMELDVLLKSDTFPLINESILKRLFTEVSLQVNFEVHERVIRTDNLLDVVENRKAAAWYDLLSNYFDCLYCIAKAEQFHLTYIEGFHIVEPAKIWKLYTTEGYQMDNHYRHFHYAFGNTLKAPNSLLDDVLKKSAEVVEGLYHQWYLKKLTSAWTNAISDDIESLGYVSDITKQRDFYRKYISAGESKGNRIFVIISDALRYEVAAELAEKLMLATKGKATIDSMQTVFPGTTQFGMAALLPGKELSVNNKLDVLLDGSQTGTTASRESLLKASHENSVAISYSDILHMKKQERRDLVQDKKVVYIYHNAIDVIGDKLTTESKVFEACETAINELVGLVKIIVNDLSSTSIFITADHGFLYTYKPLEESEKLSRQAFNGEVYHIGRRYALTAPDTTADFLLSVNMDKEICGMPVKGYTPQDTIRIKVQGGGSNYVHGGISLQEMVIPVIVYKGMRAGYKDYVEIQNPRLLLISESRKVANLMTTLTFLQNQAVGEKIQPCVYTVYFTDDTGAVISDKQTVNADKESSNASEREFRVRLNLKSDAYDRKKVYRLVIANDTDVPEEIEFRIDIAFADDYGFDL